MTRTFEAHISEGMVTRSVWVQARNLGEAYSQAVALCGRNEGVRGVIEATVGAERFEVTGWFSGDDCDPPEPGKRWLNIGLDGDEFCIVVQREVNGVFDEQTEHERIVRAEIIAEALNTYWVQQR